MRQSKVKYCDPGLRSYLLDSHAKQNPLSVMMHEYILETKGANKHIEAVYCTVCGDVHAYSRGDGCHFSQPLMPGVDIRMEYQSRSTARYTMSDGLPYYCTAKGARRRANTWRDRCNKISCLTQPDSAHALWSAYLSLLLMLHRWKNWRIMRPAMPSSSLDFSAGINK